MLKKLLLILIIIIGLLFSMTLIKIDKQEDAIKRIIQINNPIKISEPKFIQVEQPIGEIVIPKIGIKKPLFKINSTENNIEKNITILKGSTYPDQENSILYIAAHSGTGIVAFFQDLDKLKLEDKVKIIYHNQEYWYSIINIYEQPKNGFIRGKKEEKKQLVLTTCCPNKKNCQLIINAIEKES